jgi:hypothetical protein
LRVGLDSLPSGPLYRPPRKRLVHFDRHVRETNRFRALLSRSLSPTETISAELFPNGSEATRSGYLHKAGALSKSKRFFLLSRRCLYHYLDVHRRELRGVTPLGGDLCVQRETFSRCFTLAHREADQSLCTVQMEGGGAVAERMQREIVLFAADPGSAEAWVDAIREAQAHEGPYVDVEEACVRIGTVGSNPSNAAALLEALKRTQEVLS